MKRFVTVTGKDEGGEAGGGNLYAELLVKLPDQTLLWGFSGFNLTARKLPEACELFTTRPLSYENAPVDVHKRGRSDQNRRLGDTFGLHAGLIARWDAAA